jgi:carbon-monoxide dehydrogenase medium subunit
VNNFDYSRPTRLKEAIALLKGRGAKVIAGGTDLLVQMRQGEVRPSRLVDVSGLPELSQIKTSKGGGLRIGSATLIRTLERDPLIRERFPIISQAAAYIGSVQIRNLATVGGNLCNAAPSADMAPPLLTLGARAIIAGPKGEKTMALEDFFRGPGETVLGKGELLVALELDALPKRSGGCYQRITTRKAMDIAFIGVASVIVLDGKSSKCKEARIALGAVAPTPIRAREAENMLAGCQLDDESIEAAAGQAAEEARPISDLRAGAEYRREMVKVLTRRTLHISLKSALAGGIQQR